MRLDDLVGLASLSLRIPPHRVWKCTIPELSILASRIPGDAEPLDRAAFESLMRRFPDA